MRPILIRTHSRRITKFIPLLLLLTSGGLIFAHWNSSASSNRLVLPQQNKDAQLEVELITATPSGFEPASLTRPQGRFILAIDNRSGLDQLDLYLDRDTGARLNTALSRKGKLKWRDVVDLQSGRYVLRSANDPNWRCDINLTPK